MKKFIIPTLLVILLSGILTGCNEIPEASGASGAPPVFSVREVADDPLAFNGVITITGIVTRLSDDSPTLFGIGDALRRACCADIVLPVSYSGDGEIPTLGDYVNVTGEWGNTETGIVFLVFDIEKL